MSENSNVILYALIAIGLICLVMTGIAIAKIGSPIEVDYDKIGAMIDAKISNIQITAPAVAVPTAAEIAALVVIPSADVKEITDNDKINDLWDVEYSDEVYTLKAEAAKFILDEMDFNVSAFNVSAVIDSDTLDAEIAKCSLDESGAEDILDEVKIAYDEVKDNSIQEDDTEVVITNLGINEVDDQKATVNLVLKVKYNTMDSDDTVKKYIVITGEYFKDKHGDADSKITYALKA